MVYKSGQIFLPFCHNATMHACDRQTDRRTEFSSLYRVCITFSAVKMSEVFSRLLRSPSTGCILLPAKFCPHCGTIWHLLCARASCQWTSVRFIGGWGFNPPLVHDDPPTGDCKVWSGGRIWPPQRGLKSKFVVKSLWTNVRHYSDPPPKTFCNGL